MEEQNNDIKITPEEKVNPWVTIFFRPSHTMRWLLRNETAKSAGMMWLSLTALFMVMAFLTVMFFPGVIDRTTSKIQLVIATPFIFALSWMFFVVESYLLSSVSGWLGGRASGSEMRIVNAFTTVIPGVVFGFINIGLALLFGRESSFYDIGENIIVVWTIYITACGIGVAAEVPPWKGLLVYVSTILLWIAAIAVGTAVWSTVLPRFF